MLQGSNYISFIIIILMSFIILNVVLSWILLWRQLNLRNVNSNIITIVDAYPTKHLKTASVHSNAFTTLDTANSLPVNEMDVSLLSSHPSIWFARKGESFSEGFNDMKLQKDLKRQQQSIPAHIEVSSIQYLLAIGPVARELGIDNKRFLWLNKELIQGEFPHFQTIDHKYHLSKSSTVNDPHWYLSKNNIVSKNGDGSIRVAVLAYQKPPASRLKTRLFNLMFNEPWQKNSHYNFWVKTSGSSWRPAGQSGLVFIPILKGAD